eukprot:scaffold2.g7266.t1
MSDAVAALEARLANLEQNGIKLNPATANPAPLGLYGFDDLVGESNAQAYGQIMGFAMFFGGLAQFVAGVCEYSRRNTFGFVAFCCYGAFWMSVSLYSNIFQFNGKGSNAEKGIATYAYSNATMGAYKGPSPAAQMSACWHSIWGILTFLLWLCTFNTTLVTSAIFFTLAILFWALAAADLKGPGTTAMKGAGGFGFLVAFLAMYDGTAVLMKEMYGRQILPVFPLKPINKVAAGQLGGFGTKKIVTDVEKA